MKNIVLLCAAGMSTSMLVRKMREAAEQKGFACQIEAYAISEAARVTPDADAILLGPQVRFNLKKIKEMCPDKIVECIDTRMYGLMQGDKVLEQLMDLLGE